MEYESDETLARIAEQDEARRAAAVTILFRRYLSRVYSLCRRYFDVREDIEEAASEAMVRATRALTGGSYYRGEARYATWLMRIAANTCLERLRQPRLPILSLETLLDTGGDIAQPVPAREPEEVRDAIRRLPDEQGLAIALCDLEGYSAKEAAQIMQRSVEAMKSLHYRARRALRDMLVETDEQGGVWRSRL